MTEKLEIIRHAANGKQYRAKIDLPKKPADVSEYEEWLDKIRTYAGRAVSGVFLDEMYAISERTIEFAKSLQGEN